MTEEETQAYQLALLWTQKTTEYFPQNRTDGNRLRATGDPRKSSLFKYCIRMLRRTKNLIPAMDMKHYMVAQLWICKQNTPDGECHVGPEMLSGPTAWKRWKIYEKALITARERRAGNSNPAEEQVSMEIVRADLDRSQTFLQKYALAITPEFLLEHQKKANIAKWLKFGFIRPYFVALSPTLQKFDFKIEELSGIKTQELILLYKTYFPKDV